MLLDKSGRDGGGCGTGRRSKAAYSSGHPRSNIQQANFASVRAASTTIFNSWVLKPSRAREATEKSFA
jgi:hypothetical protein